MVKLMDIKCLIQIVKNGTANKEFYVMVLKGIFFINENSINKKKKYC